MGLALDEPKEEDEIVHAEGFKVVVDRGLLRQAGRLEIDYHNGPFRRGFKITPTNQGGSC